MMTTMTAILLGRLGIAMVWIYQGFWCKVLGKMPRHRQVVEATPFFNGRHARQFLLALGLFETVLGVWVISGLFPRAAALVQTCLLLGMNAGGLIWARAIIPDPIGMVFQNFAFLTLIWICG